MSNADHRRLPSIHPPRGFRPHEVPQFIVLGSDDNQMADGVWWLLEVLQGKANPPGTDHPETFDGGPLRASFYLTPGYPNGPVTTVTEDVIQAWKAVHATGHEMARSGFIT